VTALSRWIRSSQDVAALAAHLARSPAVALDTEADSLHHYPERLCLVQVADAAGAAHLVDPLSPADLSPLGAVFADPAVLKVVHAGDNDLAALKRRYGFAFASLFDTYIAARFLGLPELGLDALLEGGLGIALGPSRQKDDWSVRPLTPEQEAYALDDVRYLIPLKDDLLGALRARGRDAWVLEECAALAEIVPPVKVDDPDAYLDLKGARHLAPRSLAVLRELHALRETLARSAARPPFKILGNETLLELAGTPPHDITQLAQIRGCTPRVVGRWGEAILAAIARAEGTPEALLPVMPRRPRPVVPAEVRRRIEALRAWRAAATGRLALDAGVLLPGRLIERIAEAAPADVASLARVDGVRRWRVDALGAEIVAAIAADCGRAGAR
jgi:ribonuclease D